MFNSENFIKQQKELYDVIMLDNNIKKIYFYFYDILYNIPIAFKKKNVFIFRNTVSNYFEEYFMKNITYNFRIDVDDMLNDKYHVKIKYFINRDLDVNLNYVIYRNIRRPILQKWLITEEFKNDFIRQSTNMVNEKIKYIQEYSQKRGVE